MTYETDPVLAGLAQRARQHLAAFSELMRELHDTLTPSQQFEVSASITYLRTLLDERARSSDSLGGQTRDAGSGASPQEGKSGTADAASATAIPTPEQIEEARLNPRPMRKLALVQKLPSHYEQSSAGQGLHPVDPKGGAA